MSSESYPLRQSGIYRNLPTFDPSLKNLKAIICGATGISGYHSIRALLDTPDRWSTIYALSRGPLSNELLSLLTPQQRERVEHVSVDLTATGSIIADQLLQANVRADYIFFYAYLSPKTTGGAMSPDAGEELVERNVPLLGNFLQAISLANIEPKRILLQTGGKNYGMHIGRVRTPLVESDPQPRHLGPNFYYLQEDMLRTYCAAHPDTSWNVIRPAAVVGSTTTINLNIFYPFAVYATIQAYKKKPLIFGGDFQEWQFEACHSTARLNAYLSEWAVLEDKCAGQAFNAQDGSPLSWDRFFQELARWYGVDQGVQGPEENAKHMRTILMKGGKEGPLGYGPPLSLKLSYTLVEWAMDGSNHDTWIQIMQQSGGRIKLDPFENVPAMFMGDFAYTAFGQLSQNKVRRLGFNGFVDTLESIFEMYVELAVMGVLPPPKVQSARPLI